MRINHSLYPIWIFFVCFLILSMTPAVAFQYSSVNYDFNSIDSPSDSYMDSDFLESGPTPSTITNNQYTTAGSDGGDDPGFNRHMETVGCNGKPTYVPVLFMVLVIVATVYSLWYAAQPSVVLDKEVNTPLLCDVSDSMSVSTQASEELSLSVVSNINPVNYDYSTYCDVCSSLNNLWNAPHNLLVFINHYQATHPAAVRNLNNPINRNDDFHPVDVVERPQNIRNFPPVRFDNSLGFSGSVFEDGDAKQKVYSGVHGFPVPGAHLQQNTELIHRIPHWRLLNVLHGEPDSDPHSYTELKWDNLFRHHGGVICGFPGDPGFDPHVQAFINPFKPEARLILPNTKDMWFPWLLLMMHFMPPEDIADWIERLGLNLEETAELLSYLSTERAARALAHLDSKFAAKILKNMDEKARETILAQIWTDSPEKAHTLIHLLNPTNAGELKRNNGVWSDVNYKIRKDQLNTHINKPKQNIPHAIPVLYLGRLNSAQRHAVINGLPADPEGAAVQLNSLDIEDLVEILKGISPLRASEIAHHLSTKNVLKIILKNNIPWLGEFLQALCITEQGHIKIGKVLILADLIGLSEHLARQINQIVSRLPEGFYTHLLSRFPQLEDILGRDPAGKSALALECFSSEIALTTNKPLEKQKVINRPQEHPFIKKFNKADESYRKTLAENMELKDGEECLRSGYGLFVLYMKNKRLDKLIVHVGPEQFLEFCTCLSIKTFLKMLGAYLDDSEFKSFMLKDKGIYEHAQWISSITWLPIVTEYSYRLSMITSKFKVVLSYTLLNNKADLESLVNMIPCMGLSDLAEILEKMKWDESNDSRTLKELIMGVIDPKGQNILVMEYIAAAINLKNIPIENIVQLLTKNTVFLEAFLRNIKGDLLSKIIFNQEYSSIIKFTPPFLMKEFLINADEKNIQYVLDYCNVINSVMLLMTVDTPQIEKIMISCPRCVEDFERATSSLFPSKKERYEEANKKKSNMWETYICSAKLPPYCGSLDYRAKMRNEMVIKIVDVSKSKARCIVETAQTYAKLLEIYIKLDDYEKVKENMKRFLNQPVLLDFICKIIDPELLDLYLNNIYKTNHKLWKKILKHVDLERSLWAQLKNWMSKHKPW